MVQTAVDKDLLKLGMEWTEGKDWEDKRTRGQTRLNSSHLEAALAHAIHFATMAERMRCAKVAENLCGNGCRHDIKKPKTPKCGHIIAERIFSEDHKVKRGVRKCS